MIPLILIKNFEFLPDFKEKIYCDIVNEFDQIKHTLTTPKGYNFSVTFNKSLFDYLYFKFFYTVCKIFKPVELSDKNSTVVWAYVNNKDFYYSAIHNHKNTATINGVFYFNVPRASKKKQGPIIFLDEKNNEVARHYPEENDLLIFPGTLNHIPLQSNTKDYRIALNIEILCNNDVWSNYIKRKDK
jgi:hypothetical protein